MKKTVKADLCVVGAGYAGICAAVAAARNGVKVALVNDRDVPGGNASSEHRIHVNGGANNHKSYYSRESGIADELKMETFHHNPLYNKKVDYHLCDMALVDIILAEENILYFPSTAIYDCETADGKITKAFGLKSRTEDDICFECDLFCDASGDGILAFKAGAEFRVGREAASEFNESLAPEKADNCVMGSCILFRPMQNDRPIKYRKPDFAYDFVGDGIIKYFDRPDTGRVLPKKGGPYNNMWWLEFGGLNDTIREADDIDFELRKIIYGYWDYVKNSGLFPDAENLSLEWIAPYASKRESRRFMGEKILCQSDIEECRDFVDAVSTGGWSLDIHDVGGVYGNELTSAFGEVPSMYNIPLSIMISKDISNLFLAGRIVSCTHVALGSVRVMQTLGAMGQAVGTAAAVCKKYGENPSDTRKNHIKEIQAILQHDGQYIMGRPEDCGFARTATVTASSEKLFENTIADTLYPLKNEFYLTIPISENMTGSIEVKLKNIGENKQTLKYKICGESRISTYTCGEVISKGEKSLPANEDGFISFSLGDVAEGSKVFLVLEENPDIGIYGAKTKVTGAVHHGIEMPYGSEESISFAFRGVETAADIYSAKNAINGYPRPYGKPNCWISKGNDNEWLELELEKPTDISEVQIYFNPQYENDHFNSPIKSLVTDYSISVFSENGIIERHITDNYLGRNAFDIEAVGVTKVRFDFNRANAKIPFEVFAVKIF